MDHISKSLGLRHISEQVFMELGAKDLVKCEKVNSSWKNLLENPHLWVKICVKQKKIIYDEEEKEWLKLILKDPTRQKHIVPFLKLLADPIHDLDHLCFYCGNIF